MSEKELSEIVSANIRKYMQRKDLTQNELRDLLNVSQATISAWVTGRKIPRTKSLDAMCEIFGCKRSDILNDVNSLNAFMPTAEEYELIQLFKGLNDEGQAEILKYARLISNAPIYKKCDYIQEQA